MNSYFIEEKTKAVIPIIGGVSYSTGDGLEVKSRYSYDYSKKPQGITYRRRNTALTATIQLSFTPIMCSESGNMMMDYISDLEHLCGEKVDFYWNKKNVGSFVIQSVQFSSDIDVNQIFPQMNVSISMTEGFIRRETLYTEVKTL